MAEITLESLAKRLDAIERHLDLPSESTMNWQSVVGIFEDSPFMQEVIQDILAAREAEREAARQEWELEDQRTKSATNSVDSPS